MTPNSYQIAKAKAIVGMLLSAQENSSLSRHQLAQVVALMDADQWRTISLTAGVPVADLDCKAAVLAILRGRTPHVVGATA